MEQESYSETEEELKPTLNLKPMKSASDSRASASSKRLSHSHSNDARPPARQGNLLSFFKKG